MNDLVKNARELADKINQATPKPWKRVPIKNSKNVPYPTMFEAWSFVESEDRAIGAFYRNTEIDQSAIVAARNEAPDLLTQLADEVERLQSELKAIAKIKLEDFYKENPCAKILNHKYLSPECVDQGCKALFLAEAVERIKDLESHRLEAERESRIARDKVERLTRALETVEEALDFKLDNNGIERIEASNVIVGYVKHCPDLASWLRGRDKGL